MFKTAFVLTSFLILLGCGSNSPKTVAQKWHKAIIAGDLKAANALSTENAQGTNAILIGMMSDKLNKMVQEFSKATFDVENINGDKAVVTDANSNDKSNKIELIKKDGKWLVDVNKG